MKTGYISGSAKIVCDRLVYKYLLKSKMVTLK